MHPTFTVLGARLSAHGLVLASYFGAALPLTVWVNARRGIPSQTTLFLFAVGVPAGMIGARLLDMLEYWGTYTSLAEVVGRNGSSIYGAYFVAFAFVGLYARSRGLRAVDLLDGGAPAMALGEAISRVACFLNGCCYGMPWHGPWAVTFPPQSFAFRDQVAQGLIAPTAPHTLPVHPVQLYSLAVMLFVFGYLLYAAVPHTAGPLSPPGRLFSLFLLAYGTLRLLMGPLRVEALRNMYAFSAVFIIVGAAGLLRSRQSTEHAVGQHSKRHMRRGNTGARRGRGLGGTGTPPCNAGSVRTMRGQGVAVAMSLVVISVLWSRAHASCPSLQAPQFYVYQSGATTVEIVVANTTLVGMDHWQVCRTRIGGSTCDPLLPLRLSASTASLTDEGQGLQAGQTYTYTLIATPVSGSPTSYTATAYDVGNRVNTSLGTTNLSIGPFQPGSFYYFGFDPRDGTTRLKWPYFPSPIGPTFPKYVGSARRPSTNKAMSCATVTVRDSATGQLASLWADRYGNFPHPNPLTTDRHGDFEFYAANGTYDLHVQKGTTAYDLTRVTVFDPRSPQALTADVSSAITLITSDAPATGDGNIHLKMARPNSTDGNDPGDSFYRLLADQSRYLWAVTYNVGVNESTGQLQADRDVRPAFTFGVDRPTNALEFAVDPAYGAVDGGAWISRALVLEPLLHAGPDRIHFKSVLAPVGVQAIAGQAGITGARVVSMQVDGRVGFTSVTRELHPFAVLGVEDPSGTSSVGSRIYLGVAGRGHLFIRGVVTAGDPLVSTNDGYAQAAPSETDGRYIVGYALSTGGVNGALSFMPVALR